MVSLIRDINPEEPSTTRGVAGLWKAMLLCLVVLSLLLGYYYSRAYGIISWAAFGFIGFIGMVLLWRQAFKAAETGPTRISVPVSHVLERVFARSADAGLIVENGKAVRANVGYLELVQSFGIHMTDGDPPMPEKIFEKAPDAARAALYRLGLISDEDAFEEEKVELLDEHGNLLRFMVRVTVHKQQQFWQIIDYSYDPSQDGALLSKAPIGLLVVNEDGKVVSANDVFREWTGYDGALSKLQIKDFIEHPEALLSSPQEANRTVRFDTRLVTQKDIATPIVLVATWHILDTGQYIASIALHGHSTVTKRGEHAGASDLKGLTSGENSQTLENATPVDAGLLPFAFVDLDMVDLSKASIVEANTAFEKLSGLTEWRNLSLRDVITRHSSGPDIFSLPVNELTPDKPVDAAIQGKEGTAVSVYACLDHASETCRLYLVDISARKALEDQLIQSQKMQAVGRLVAEIAHDFNNLLAAIRLYTDTLLGRHPIGDPSYPELQQINANGNRAAALVKKLLAYSRKQTIRAERLDVSETLSDMAVTLKQVLGEKVKLDIRHGRDLPDIRVDKSQFDTVLMNLAVNARDAMKEQGGGQITIESRVFSKSGLDNAGLKAALDKLPGDQIVAISVADTGTGITDEIKSKIFEPFFTTKAQGEGTGLGLSTVYGIVQQSGGHLAVDSEMGVGTTFTIYLPEAGEDTEADLEAKPVARKGVKLPPKAPADLAGQGNILFVEDEASVRVIAAKTLRKRGYNVIEACDGEEAYELIQEAEAPFDLMISDVVMPGMDGPTLLKKARPELTETRIVFISGYAEEEFSDLLAEEPDVTFLPKPFTLIQLAEKVKQQIGEVV